MLIVNAGDIHPNPGPVPHTSNTPSSPAYLSSSTTESTSINFPFSKYLSVLHYNVQNLRNKVDLIQSECSNFDIIALTESWLDTSVENDAISMKSFHPPERKDRHYDYHGGVIVYVKESLYYKRRSDLGNRVTWSVYGSK